MAKIISDKTLLFISTHVINKAVIDEYLKLSKSKNYDCLLVIDNTDLGLTFESRTCVKNFYDKKVKCFIFDEEIHKELGLPYITYNKLYNNFSEVMWYNADYRFYYVKHYLSGYKYYWQFDYDVFCNDISYENFLEKYKNKKEDLLITFFRRANKNSPWIWTNNVDWIYDDEVKIYGSFFPVCRLSKTAIDFLYKRRLDHAEIFNNAETKEKCWLNCEIFVPTELMKNKFSCDIIDEKNVTLEELDLNEDRIFEHPDGMLYHPVKGNFLNRIKNLSPKSHICINFFIFKMKFRSNKFIYIE